MNKTRMAVAAAAGVLISGAALGDETWRPGIDVGASAQYTNMRELIDGHTVVEESGWLPGLVGRVFIQNGEWRLGVSGYVYNGSLDYNGRTQAGSPFDTSTDTTYAGGQFDAAWRRDAWEARGFAGFAYWQRSVQGRGNVGGANENYSWGAVGGGASYRFDLSPAFALKPGLDVWYNFAVTQQATSGGFDTATLHPGGDLGLRLGLPLIWKYTANSDVVLRPYLQTFQFGQSQLVLATRNGVPTGTALYQPAIHYMQPGINLEFEQRF